MMRMASHEKAESRTRFTRNFSSIYPPSTQFQIGPLRPNIEAKSSRAFRSSRQILVDNCLLKEKKHHEMSQAITSEYLVQLALNPFLQQAGFSIQPAPQSLEHGMNGQKGVDLIVSDQTKLIYLGIDVKLRQGRSILDRDGYGWNQNLLSPYIYLSLGNAELSMREGTSLTVREWLQSYALPKINSTGKLPQWRQLQQYIVGRIERSLYGYIESLSGDDDRSFGLPVNQCDREILNNKIAVVHQLFSDLRQI